MMVQCKRIPCRYTLLKAMTSLFIEMSKRARNAVENWCSVCLLESWPQRTKQTSSMIWMKFWLDLLSHFVQGTKKQALIGKFLISWPIFGYYSKPDCKTTLWKTPFQSVYCNLNCWVHQNLLRLKNAALVLDHPMYTTYIILCLSAKIFTFMLSSCLLFDCSFCRHSHMTYNFPTANIHQVLAQNASLTPHTLFPFSTEICFGLSSLITIWIDATILPHLRAIMFVPLIMSWTLYHE